MIAITFVLNAAVLNALWIRTAMSVLIGLGMRWRPILNRRSLKAKDPLSRPPSPSNASVLSAQLLTVTSDDVDCHIARLGQELSTSFTRQFNDLSSFYVHHLIKSGCYC